MIEIFNYFGILSVLVSLILIFPHFWGKDDISITHIIRHHNYTDLKLGFFLQPLLFILFVFAVYEDINSILFAPVAALFIVSFSTMLLIPYTHKLFHHFIAFTYFVGTFIGAVITPFFISVLLMYLTAIIIITQIAMTLFSIRIKRAYIAEYSHVILSYIWTIILSLFVIL